MLDDELKRAFALIKAQPELGPADLDVAMAGVRRAFLRDTRYFALILSPAAIHPARWQVNEKRGAVPLPGELNGRLISEQVFGSRKI